MERDLIRRAKAREGEAVAAVAVGMERLIRATVRKVQPFAKDEENLIGEGFLILMECIDDYDESKGVPFPFYFRKRFRYFLLDDLKRSLRFKMCPVEDAASFLADDDVEEEALGESRARELAGMLALLSPQEEQVIRLFYYGSLSLSEVAGVLGVSYQTVANTKSRALRKLRGVYEAGQTVDSF